ncbi:thioredoxin family protein [bacterium]|nr:thioredoxin family protein [bacterium]
MDVIKKTILLLVILFSVVSFLSAQEAEVSFKVEQDGDIGQIEATFTIPDGHHQSYEIDDEYAQFYLYSETPGLELGQVTYPLTDGKEAGEIIKYYNSITLTLPFKITDPELNKIDVDYSYQLCLLSGACLRPMFNTEEISITPLSELLEIEQEAVGETSSTSKALYFILLAFLGGIILNVMPCVLPVLSIRAMSLVRQSQGDKSQILKGSLAYTFGILISFAILAAIVVIIKSTGESLSWGFQFQNPWFVFGLIVLIWVFTLSLFDVFQLRVPGMNMATQASNKGGLAGSFFSGIFAVLLATPCTAPLLAPAIGFAFQQPPTIIFISFIMIGLGLALPFLILGFAPKAVKLIPKPGDWMTTFSEIMGFLLFGTALYLLYSLYYLISGNAFLHTLTFLLILSFACWIYGRFAGPISSVLKQWIWTIVALALIFGSAHYLLDYNTDTVIVGDESHNPPTAEWQKFSEEILQQYRNEGKPVLVAFGAKWCTSCKVNEANVFKKDDIREFFKEKKVELLYGDNTRKNELIEKWLTKYQRAGVPFYIYFAPGAEEGVVLPEIIYSSTITNLIK